MASIINSISYSDVIIFNIFECKSFIGFIGILKKTFKSFEKYIPLVKQTSCTIILPTPPDAFSLTRLPINIPNAINNIETNIDAIIVNIIFIYGKYSEI